MHVFVQMVCALVKPTIMARKMVRARRGTDSKRPAEPRRAERRHDREAAREHIGTIVLVHCWFRFCIRDDRAWFLPLLKKGCTLSPWRLEEIPAVIASRCTTRRVGTGRTL